MRWLTLVVASVALLLPASGHAALPDGFRASWPLAKRATMIAAVPGVHVYCAARESRWNDFLLSVLGRMGEIDGYTVFASREILLAPWVCRPLEAQVRGRRVADRALAEAMHTLVHEALHARGVRDEMVAECRSLRMLSAVARDRFAVRSAERRGRLVDLAHAASYCER